MWYYKNASIFFIFVKIHIVHMELSINFYNMQSSIHYIEAGGMHMRQATLKDLDGIIEIIKSIVKEMNSQGNYQWNDNYPSSADFVDDIESGDLYVEESDGKIASFICLNTVEAPEYKELEWSIDKKALVIHRMGVNPSFRGSGLAKKLMKFADELTVEKNLNYIRVDTSSENMKMDSLLKKCGFKYIGMVKFAGIDGNFCCYDKIIG